MPDNNTLILIAVAAAAVWVVLQYGGKIGSMFSKASPDLESIGPSATETERIHRVLLLAKWAEEKGRIEVADFLKKNLSQFLE